MMRALQVGSVASTLLLAGCVGAPPDRTPSPLPPVEHDEARAAAVSPSHRFRAGLELFAEHDRKNDWTDERCKETADAFLDASSASSRAGAALPEALYNAGVALQRCGRGEARAIFERLLEAEPSNHRARTRLALLSYKERGEAALESTIGSLQRAVLDAEFQNTEALIGLAALQMKRASGQGGAGCQSDLDCAKKNIQRALAVDDGFMPAFNQLALYYLERARERGEGRARHAPGRPGEPSAQQLELAALVCSQAVRKNPKYAPIHNTAGLIQVELGNPSNAAAEFKLAAELAPDFFEAHMNHAAVNLSFRGFKAAEGSYRAAAALAPGDYDAHLGLSLALRGQISEPSLAEGIKATQEELDRAKKIAPDRPEAYFNEGILTHEFRLRAAATPQEQLKALRDARDQLNVFIEKAGPAPAFVDGVKRARQRIEDIDETVRFQSSAPG